MRRRPVLAQGAARTAPPRGNPGRDKKANVVRTSGGVDPSPEDGRNAAHRKGKAARHP